MSGKIYNKNLTFLQDQPFAENLLTGFFYKKRRDKLLSRTDSFPGPGKQVCSSNLKSSYRRSRSRSSHSEDKERFARTKQSFVRAKLCAYSGDSSGDSTKDDTLPSNTKFTFGSKNKSTRVSFGSTGYRNKSDKMRKAEASLVKHFCSILERFSSNKGNSSLYTRVIRQKLECSSEYRVGKVIPHLLASVDSMQNTLLATRDLRSTERIKAPSHFKKILQESRKVRLLYGNLSRRQFSRGISKKRYPGETLLIWLESRLDVVLERCGFFDSVKGARQAVCSGNIMVNSLLIKSPGFILEGGDIIKVIQKEKFFNPLVKQHSRGAIISNQLFRYSYRKKHLVHALSTILQKPKPIDYLNQSLICNKIYQGKKANICFDSINMVDKNFARSRSPKREFSSYNSFFTWLLEKKQINFQSSENRARQSNALISRESQYKKCFSESTIDLQQKNLSLNNWRFISSPHLLFSLFFLHGHLEKVTSLLADSCNKTVSFKSNDKAFVKLFSYKTQEYNNTTKPRSEKTHYFSGLFPFIFYRTYLNLPTIFFTCKQCVVNTFTSKSYLDLCVIKKKEGNYGEGELSLDTLNIELFLNYSRQSLHKIMSTVSLANSEINRTSYSQSMTFTNVDNFFGEKSVPVLTELYNNLSPWFISSNPFEIILLTQQNNTKVNSVRNSHASVDLSVRTNNAKLDFSKRNNAKLDSVRNNHASVDFSKRNNAKLDLSVSTNNAKLDSVRNNHASDDFSKRNNAKLDCVSNNLASVDLKNTPKEEKGLLSLLLANLLLYSLFIRKELVFLPNRESAHFEKKQVEVNNRIVSHISPVGGLSDKKQKTFNSRHSQGSYKKFNSNQNQRVDLNLGERIKPLHLEVSYQSLCAVYLFPPQRVCLPIMVDLDYLSKAL